SYPSADRRERQRPRRQGLVVDGADDALDEVDLHDTETVEWLRGLDLERAVAFDVADGERRNRGGARRRGADVGDADVIGERLRIHVARELDPDRQRALGVALAGGPPPSDH